MRRCTGAAVPRGRATGALERHGRSWPRRPGRRPARSATRVARPPEASWSPPPLRAGAAGFVGRPASLPLPPPQRAGRRPGRRPARSATRGARPPEASSSPPPLRAGAAGFVDRRSPDALAPQASSGDAAPARRRRRLYPNPRLPARWRRRLARRRLRARRRSRALAPQASSTTSTPARSRRRLLRATRPQQARAAAPRVRAPQAWPRWHRRTEDPRARAPFWRVRPPSHWERVPGPYPGVEDLHSARPPRAPGVFLNGIGARGPTGTRAVSAR